MALEGMNNIPPDQLVNPQLAPVSGPQANYQPAPLQPDENAAQAAGAAALTPAVPLPSSLSPSIADQLSKLGFASRVHQTADKLAATSPNPNAPGAWARSLVGATSSALAGFGNIASDIAAGAEKPVPLGAPGGIVGIARALQNRKQRQQEMQTEAFQKKHAMAQEQIDMMHVDQARRGMAKDDPDLAMLDQHVANDAALIKPYTEGGENGEGAAPVLGQHLTQDQVAKQIQEGKLSPTQMHRFADGKVPTGEKDKYGNPVYEQTYTVVGDSPEVTITPEVAARLKAGHVTGADGKEIQAGQVLPGYVYGTVSQKLQNQETANQAVRIAREKGDLEELTDKEKIDNQKLINDYGNFYSKAHSDPNTDPEDARMMAYNHMVNDPQYTGQIPQIQNLLFGSSDKADKAMKDFRVRHDEAFLEPMLKDPDDPITSWGEIAKQRDGKGNMTPAALAATRQLNNLTPQEIEAHRKDVANEQQKKADNPTQTPGIINPEVQEKLNKLPANTQDQLSNYTPDQLNSVYNVAYGSDDLYKLFPSRKYKGTNGLTTQEAAQVAHLMNPQYDVTRAPVYAATRKEFTDGTIGKSLNNMNTALPHLANLLDHTSFWSTVPGFKSLSALSGGVGAKAQTDLNQASNELASFYKGGAAATENEIEAQKEALSGSTPAEQRTKLMEAARLLRSKQESYERQWQDGGVPGTKPPKQIVTPEAQAALDKILGPTKTVQVPSQGTATNPNVTVSIPTGNIQVQIPGQAPGHIPKSALAQFQKDHPNAVITGAR